MANPTGTHCEAVHYRPAIILYPAFLTPAIITGDQDLEIVLLGKEGKEISEGHVAHQLKVSDSLDPRKQYTSQPLNSGSIKKVEKIGNIKSDPVISTGSRFKGLLHNTIRDKQSDLQNEDYNALYCVHLDQGILNGQSKSNLIWIYKKDETNVHPIDDGSSGKKALYPEEDGKIKVGESHAWFEPQDQILRNVLKDMSGDEIDGKGKYCFGKGGEPSEARPNHPVGKRGIPTEIDPTQPIQSYHPVFNFEDLSAASIAHVADLHLCARQHVMSYNTAQVIEGADTQISPPVGKHVNVNLNRFRDLLFRAGGDPEVDILLIGGDIVDYIRSVYPGQDLDDIKKNGNVLDVWDKVQVGGEYRNEYHDFVDFISFYTLILWFYRKFGKPVFIVSGNHDAYHEPYGISPRLTEFDTIKRFNSGIPADHNMTIYEAILCFGDTYSEYHSDSVWGNTTGSVMPFDKEMFRWFYSVFTPFSDFAVFLQNQELLGLEWGDSEDIAGVVHETHHGGWYGGYVPRADYLLKSRQENFIEEVIDEKDFSNIVLLTHFTFASYIGSEPTQSPDRDGYIHYNVDPLEDVAPNENYLATPFDAGTFEERREFLYSDCFEDQDAFELVLTGHTHRRGLYQLYKPQPPYDADDIDRMNTSLHSSFDDPERQDTVPPLEPLIAVSDSAGPLPVYNFQGLLGEFGRAHPGGLKIVFDRRGDIDSVRLIRGENWSPVPYPWRRTSAPRFVVALDYLDLFGDRDVLQKFERVPPDDKYKYDVQLHADIDKLVVVDDIILYIYTIAGDWVKLNFKTVGESGLWQIQQQNKARRIEKKDLSQSFRSFLAMRFAEASSIDDETRRSISHYEFESYWCFPVSKGALSFDEFWRTKGLAEFPTAEIPDLEWRRAYYSDR